MQIARAQRRAVEKKYTEKEIRYYGFKEILMSHSIPRCLVCELDSTEVPLIELRYCDQSYWICPQHFPILIHQPQLLVGKLPGAERLEPHEHD